MSGCRSKAGRLFQILRPATEKLRSPSQMYVSSGFLGSGAVILLHIAFIIQCQCLRLG